MELNKSAPCQLEPERKGKTWSVGTLTYTTGGLAILCFWLLWGDFAWSMKDRVVPPVVQLLLRKFEISDFLAGILMGSLPPLLGLLIGPVISCWSDRHRGSWGRRIPFLLIPTPLIVLSIVAIAFSPEIGRWLHKAFAMESVTENAAIIAVFAAFWICFEVATITANSVFGGLVNDVVPRKAIGRFYGLFRAVSLIAGIIFNYTLMGCAGEKYMPIFLGVGALYGFGFTVMCLRVKEGSYPEPEAKAPGAHPLLSVKTYFLECFSSPYYLGLFAMGALVGMSASCVNIFSIYAAESFGLSMTVYGYCLAATYVCSLVLAYPLGALVDRFHPLPLGLIGMALYALTMLCSFLWVQGPLSFEIALIAHGVVSGCIWTVSSGQAALLFPRAKFSQFCSAGGIIGSIGGMLVGPILGRLLDNSGHNYIQIFAAGFILMALALAAGLPAYLKFLALGGPSGYVAPEPRQSPSSQQDAA